ncbi:MAG: peptidoglycan editing factor PgeF [Nocardioidaceae bacterium]
MFAFRTSLGPVGVAFTDRFGGVSAGAYAELNLGSRDSRPDEFTENLRRVVTELGGALEEVVLARQVHGADVSVVEAVPTEPPAVDALVTAAAGLTLVVRVADCTPVLLADPDAGVIGAVHAGRRGLAAGVVPAAVTAMRDLGAERIVAWLGPRACGRCYEVPAALRDHVAAAAPAAAASTSWGTPSLDVAAGLVAQLRRAGVEPSDLADSMPMCTIEEDRYFSYRRQGPRSGRMAALVRLQP